jgi:hypothetical protein
VPRVLSPVRTGPEAQSRRAAWLGRVADPDANELRELELALADVTKRIDAAGPRVRERLRIQTIKDIWSGGSWSPFVSERAAGRDRRGTARSATAAAALDVPLDVVMPEVQNRLRDWRSVLGEESPQARQMLRFLLRGRLVFTPRQDREGVRFAGEGDLGGLFAGLNDSQALAFPTGSRDTYEPGTEETYALPLVGIVRKAA